jgi:branched-chain amino acid transport system substrate-binding protein
VSKRGFIGLLTLVSAALAFAAAGCGGGGGETSGGGGGGGGTTAVETGGGAGGETTGGGGGGGTVTALPSSSCGPLEYEGEGSPQLIIASDLPLQGSSRTQTEQIVGAIRFLLKQQNYKAGDFNVAYQSCDDATAQAAKWDSGKCSQNANNYAANQAVIAVIGTFNSGCAQVEIPVLNQAPGGPIPMVSPANTYVCLTEPTDVCKKTGEPDKYYPTGTRNYVRVAPHDAYQGAADAEFLRSIGVKKVYILNDKEAYGFGVAKNFQGAAQLLGIQIAGFEAWDPKQSSYEALYQKIKQSGADAVFLGGLIDENGAKLIKDKVAVLGPNAEKGGGPGVVLMGPDGFTTQQTIDEAGTAAAGMYMSVAGVPIDEFQGPALDFIDQFKQTLGGKPVDPYAIYGAAAAQLALDSIAKSDGTRASVLENIFEYQVSNGLIGSFSINENGDPQGGAGAVVGFTIYKATDKLETVTTISPKPEDVDAARVA